MSLGPHFAGANLSISWLNALLYMLEISLALYYFSRFRTERTLQFLLYGLLLADTICTVTVLASTWLLLINSFQSYSFSESHWTVPLSTFMLTVVAVGEELFLINRCRRLFQPNFILAMLFSLVIAHGILELYSGCYVVAFPSTDPNARRYGNKAAAIAASIASTVDLFVPLALIWQIYQVTPPQFSKQRSWRDTIVNVISSGGCGGVMSIVLLVLFWVRPDVYYVLVNSMGRVYTITIFVNLLVSRRRSSPYDMPDGTKRRKLSFSANIKLYNFAKPGGARSATPISIIDKQLPPTPNKDHFDAPLYTEPEPSPSLAPHVTPSPYQENRASP
ncbi:hypothetical protein GALMADRAFT_136782 [Galerina marginata CBS 339.88]|uniref:G-protein coupled receptors family 1 profile domain-containing protein n=1 Tax=Galerina marginata (strain CBS 339.88) TaxID=685588 RepID=A0A067TK23_GALM3|nr:hypothetical protein GALMADRAFT_136782 [Galerina marginata CBS 339.88]